MQSRGLIERFFQSKPKSHENGKYTISKKQEIFPKLFLI